MYHGLVDGAAKVERPGTDAKYWIRAEQFREHLEEIVQLGRQVVPLEDAWYGARGAAEDHVVLTFDDGLASDYELAYPLLSKLGLRATFFVNTGNVGKEGYVSWKNIAQMQRGGMSFQSHSHDHVDLSRLSWGTLESQLTISKLILEARLGCPVDFLSVPYGLVNKRVVEAALRAGYGALCNSLSWPARPHAREVNRVAVYGSTTSRDLRKLVERNVLCYAARAARTSLLYLPKRLLLHFWPNRLGVRVLEANT
jgi:peptidoglycan/xylan/chitin deacetylase (PgdA/CDA1 family)